MNDHEQDFQDEQDYLELRAKVRQALLDLSTKLEEGHTLEVLVKKNGANVLFADGKYQYSEWARSDSWFDYSTWSFTPAQIKDLLNIMLSFAPFESWLKE